MKRKPCKYSLRKKFVKECSEYNEKECFVDTKCGLKANFMDEKGKLKYLKKEFGVVGDMGWRKYTKRSGAIATPEDRVKE